MTREDWLRDFGNRLAPLISENGATIPTNFRVSCGFPSRKASGQCWDKKHSADETFEIFISPFIDDPLEVAHTLLHEIIHAVVGTEKGHRKEFKKLALAVGLTGKMTSTVPGEGLKQRLNSLINEAGPYPHAKLNDYKREGNGSRLLKVCCPNCGYTVQVTRRWLNVGRPICHDGTVMQEAKDIPVDCIKTSRSRDSAVK